MDKRKPPEIAIKYIYFLKKRDPSIKKAYLFGSYAKGTVTADSDIDLAIVFENLSDTFDMQVLLMKLRRKFDNKIEPHAFRDSDFNTSNPVVNEILRHGVELF